MKANKQTILVFCLFVLTFSTLSAVSLSVAGEAELSVITKKVFPSVVKVETLNHIRRVATGVVIDNNGHIVTTALISPRDEKIFVIDSSGKRTEAEFLGMDSETHLAVLRAKEIRLQPIVLGKADDISVGSWIGVISISPENLPAVYQGVVSSFGEQGIRLNVHVGPGMSGSPVVDEKGRMIGLIRGAYSDEQPIVFQFNERLISGSGVVFNRAEVPASNMALAVPVEIVDDISGQIVEKGKVERGWAGVDVFQDQENKVEVIAVEKNSPADEAGLKKGDVLVTIEGKDVTGGEIIVKEIRRRKPGEKVTIVVDRDGETQTIELELGEYKQVDIFRDLEKQFPSLFFRSKVFPDLNRLREPRMGLYEFARRKFIGIQPQVLNPELAEYFGVKKGSGLLISRIMEDGPAEKAGLKVGDVILSVDGQDVDTPEKLMAIVNLKNKGDTITVVYLRNKKQNKAEIVVDEEE
ncbi:MAG: PDZ domain-containing protein [Candidatus Aminicenantes bacterium]|nr:PDZ domain-containing protein [Candidatus Aminicenantes bacterium]